MARKHAVRSVGGFIPSVGKRVQCVAFTKTRNVTAKATMKSRRYRAPVLS
jgi:hypothetical protein